MALNYDGRVFRTVSNTSGGDVTGATTFHYHQAGDMVWATYAGGAIRQGTLLARADAEGGLEMRYQHLTRDGAFKSGRCSSRPELLPDGRVRVHERWQWTDGAEGEGVSMIEEVAPSAAKVAIKTVGPTPIGPQHRASCHCGAVVLELDLPEGIVDPQRCDCSLCRRRGAIVGSVAQEGLRVVKGEDSLARYQFNTMTAQHHFCRTCGIYTHHRRRSDPQQFGFNVGCLDGVNPFDLGPVPTSDGVNHPSDRKA
jgi:hypothetical protein